MEECEGLKVGEDLSRGCGSQEGGRGVEEIVTTYEKRRELGFSGIEENREIRREGKCTGD